MKKTRTILLVAAAFAFAGPSAPAMPEDNSDVIELLCKSPWEFTGRFAINPQYPSTTWCNIRIFKKDGTFSTKRIFDVADTTKADDESGTWDISGRMVILRFADKHTDTLSLPLDPHGTKGSDSAGRPTHAVQLPPEAEPATPEGQQKAADITNIHQKEIVMVSGTEGATGGGFIALFGKSNFIFTNANVTAAIDNASFKYLDGTPVAPAAASLAVGRDVLCEAAPAGGTPLEFLQEVDKNAAVGDDVAVLANVAGAGIAKPITGRILAIKPDRIEISADLVPAYSGSPIIHLKTGKVIGVAMCVQENNDPVTDVSYREPIIGRYGLRVDNIKGWQNMDWRSFYTQAVQMKQISMGTSDLYHFFSAIDGGEDIKGGDYKNRAIQQCFYDLSRDLAVPSTIRKNACRNFLNALRNAAQRDMAEARQRITYDFFLRQLVDNQKARDSMADKFKALITKYGE